MLSIAIIVGVLAVLICIGGLVYIVRLRWSKDQQQQHNHHLHHGLNHHNHMQQQKGKLAMQTSNSSSNTNHSNSILRRMNNSSLIRPGNLPIKEKILLPANNNCSNIERSSSNQNHHHLHHTPGGGGEELYDEKNPDVVPYNKGNLFECCFHRGSYRDPRTLGQFASRDRRANLFKPCSAHPPLQHRKF